MANFPKTLGACVDLLEQLNKHIDRLLKCELPVELGPAVDLAYQARSLRLSVEASGETVKGYESQAKNHIIDSFKKSEIAAGRGKVASASVTQGVRAEIKDWEKFAAYVIKTKQIEFLERRASLSACEERWSAGEGVPGVDRFEYPKVNLTKVGAKK